MSRFEEAPSQVKAQVDQVIEDAFPHLLGAVMDVIYDTEKRKSNNGFILGRMSKPSNLIKYYTGDNINPEGVDYIMFLDSQVYVNLEEMDQVRLIRHELQHCLVVIDEKSGETKYKLRDHDVTDFIDEIEFNKKDSRWLERAALVAESTHDPANKEK